MRDLSVFLRVQSRGVDASMRRHFRVRVLRYRGRFQVYGMKDIIGKPFMAWVQQSA